MEKMKIAVEALIIKQDGKIDKEYDFKVVADNPFIGDDIEDSDLYEAVADEEKVKALPDGDYHVFFVGTAEYITSYNWEYGVEEIDGISIEIESLSVWKHNEPEPGKSLGEYVAP